MSFLTIELPPGLSRRGTLYQNKGRWYESRYVRWFEGALKPIGGWTQRITSAMTGKPRALLTWRANDNSRYFAIGTHQKLYAATPNRTAMVDITPAGFTAGRADAATGGGYGVGLYGVGTYGTPRSDTTALAYEASVWTLDTFGERLVGCMLDDGKLYEWALDISTPTVAAAISGAPVGCSGLVVTGEGFLFALGAGGDRRKLQWCDRGNNTIWTPSATNQAGDLDIQTQGQLMSGRRTRGVTLIWSDADVFAASYIGLPYVYNVERVGENAGIIARGAHAAADGRVFWWGQNGFYVWDGASVQSIPCEVYEDTIAGLNFTQRSKVSALTIAEFGEVWWLYPSASSTENDSAVVYNYREGHWTLHPGLVRLCGADRGVYNDPMMATTDGYVYNHETGVTWDAPPYAESGPYELGQGDQIMKVRDLILDEQTAGYASVQFKVRDWNNSADVTYGPYSAPNPASVRFAGRAARLRVEFSGAGVWGNPRVDVVAGGRR